MYEALAARHISRAPISSSRSAAALRATWAALRRRRFARHRFRAGADLALAQVDASVGGKTGVDLPCGKNLVGAFHQPRLVVADPETLRTLPEHYFTDGMGEVIKYGCIMDAALFEKLENGEIIDRMEAAIGHCIACKKVLVEEDTADKGRRMILNFGHTFGHALEKLTGFFRAFARPCGCDRHGDGGRGRREPRYHRNGHGGAHPPRARELRPAGEERLRLCRDRRGDGARQKSFGKTLNLILLKTIGDCVIHPIDQSYLVLRYKIAAEQNRERNKRGFRGRDG